MQARRRRLFGAHLLELNSPHSSVGLPPPKKRAKRLVRLTMFTLIPVSVKDATYEKLVYSLEAKLYLSCDIDRLL